MITIKYCCYVLTLAWVTPWRGIMSDQHLDRWMLGCPAQVQKYPQKRGQQSVTKHLQIRSDELNFNSRRKIRELLSNKLSEPKKNPAYNAPQRA
jgi:hypothetical protein